MGFSEDRSVESPAIDIFKDLGYKTKNLFHEVCGIDNLLGRETRSDVILKNILREKLFELNPGLSENVIDLAILELERDRSSLSLVRANHEIYGLLKNGIKIQTVEDGEEKIEIVEVIDWDEPENNDFLLASQMWIAGDLYTRRPDLVGFVNGLPLILFELKKFTVNVKHAYDDNLSDYKKTIPQLFWYNAFVILSNGLETRVGPFSAPWEHFNEWKRLNEDEEIEDPLDRYLKRSRERGKVSLEKTIKGTCEKSRFIDILENFILFADIQGKPSKIMAKNHQYLGVNRAINAYLEAKEGAGRIGVFWHTTGSGKSYSMIFFSNKIFRKYYGNYTFLIVTDRRDLDEQIYKNFEKTGAVIEMEPQIHAQNSRHLRRLLREDHRHIFTLIHKFRILDESKKKEDVKGLSAKIKKSSYPVLSERDDVIVICDEAHRTQYGEYAANMRAALPNASFIAFTATPLFKDDEKTRQVFGDYVSIYNFKQSIQDRATVPLYYFNRKPEVEVINKHLNPEVQRLIEEAELDEASIEDLQQRYPREFQIIINDKRLDLIAADIVDHYMSRGYMGKAMVVSIGRFTAVKIYDKVQRFWKRKIDELERKTQKAIGEELEQLKKDIEYMKETDMAVVVSSNQNEEEKFNEKGLTIKPHRKRMVNEDLDTKFKDPDNPLRIVFVCAMWMTGFDAPPVSTMYIDKPVRNHTLMQTISRANRVIGDKQSGIIVDYYGILRNLKKALAIYAGEPGGGLEEGEMPLREPEELTQRLEENLERIENYFKDKGIDPYKILEGKGFQPLQLIEEAMEAVLENEESKILFFSLLRLVVNSYTDLLPNPRAINYRSKVSVYVAIGESIAATIPDTDISDIERKIQNLVDISVAVKPYVPKKETELIDLSEIDITQYKKSFKNGRKRTETEKLRSIVKNKLTDLLQKNHYRINFQERLEQIVDNYNNGSINIEKYFEELTKLVNDLKEEEKRHIRENLTEEELVLYDILTRPKPKLTKKEETKVKKTVEELLETLKEQKLVLDWKKRARTRADVQLTIEDMLWEKLPEQKYDTSIKVEKSQKIYQHVYESYKGAGVSIYAEK